MRSVTRRQFTFGLLALPAAGLTHTVTIAQDAAQVIEPRGGTPVDGTPTSLCLSGEGEECVRGAVPVGIRIVAIGVDAPIEILETVQGVMQQPSDEVQVAWYKESARIGEIGNMHFAAHVNWWGFPQAVFFDLGALQEGDLVEVINEEETNATYAVEWVRQESNLEPPREEVLGMTSYEAITLMTCSGEWNSEISEYDSRTVVRARRMFDGEDDAA